MPRRSLLRRAELAVRMRKLFSHSAVQLFSSFGLFPEWLNA
jgi:hypothetical protein